MSAARVPLAIDDERGQLVESISFESPSGLCAVVLRNGTHWSMAIGHPDVSIAQRAFSSREPLNLTQMRTRPVAVGFVGEVPRR